jgi:hypothetical protein
MVVALLAGLGLSIGAETLSTRIAGAMVGLLLALLVKIVTEIFLRDRVQTTGVTAAEESQPDSGVERVRIEAERESAERRHVLHDGPGPRELHLRDAMSSISPLRSGANTDPI